jgi:TatD DNase family protein
MSEGQSSTVWIDSHAHLTMFERGEIPGVIERAVAAGVAGVLVPATGPDDLDAAIALAEQYSDRLVAAVGVHPHAASALDDRVKKKIEGELGQEEVVAVGEIGLDYHYMNSPREDQLAACAWQLDLALEVDLPVVLHNRESWADLERLLAERRGRLRGVCHSFAEGPVEAQRVVELGLVVGISGIVTFKAGHNIREMVAALSRDDVMVETDSPYLAPVPHRGRRNEPGFVVHTGARIAEVWRVGTPNVADATTANFHQLFGFKTGWAAVERREDRPS